MEFKHVPGNGGPPSIARLSNPRGMAIDSYGNFFIADQACCRVREINTIGATIEVFAGTGSVGFSGDGGAATAAKLIPYSIAFDNNNNMYIADAGNHRIRKVTPAECVVSAGPNVSDHNTHCCG